MPLDARGAVVVADAAREREALLEELLRAAAKSPCSPASTPAPLSARWRSSGGAAVERERRRQQRRGPRSGCRARPSSATGRRTSAQRGVGVAVGDREASIAARMFSRSASSRSSQLAGLARSPCPLSPPSTSVARRRARARGAASSSVAGLGRAARARTRGRLEHLEAARRGWSAGCGRPARRSPSSAVEPAHRLGGLEREAAGEHAERARTAPARRGRAGRSSSRSRRAASAGARGASRGPELSRSSRRPSRSRIAAGVSTFMRAAASSIASGRPSRRAQICSMRALVAGRERQPRVERAGAPRRTARPRARRPAAAAPARARRRCRSAARLVTTSFARGEAASRRPSSGAASSTCSKLSITQQDRVAGQHGRGLALAGAERLRRSRSRPAPGPRGRASATKRAPSANRGASRCASSSAKRDLPIPPGPVSVSSRTSRVVEQLDGGREVLVAAEQRRRRERQRRRARATARRGRGRCGASSSSAGSWDEDRRLEALELRARVQPEVLDQRVPRAPVGLQRVGLAAASGRARASAARAGARGTACSAASALELARRPRRGGRARGRARCAARARRAAAPASRSASTLAGPEQRRVGQRRRRGTAPAPRAAARRRSAGSASRAPARRASRSAARSSAPSARAAIAYPPGRVTIVSGAERAPQLGDMHLQRLAGRRRRVLAPQHVDQALGGDGVLAVREQQHRQQRPLLGRLDLDRPLRSRRRAAGRGSRTPLPAAPPRTAPARRRRPGAEPRPRRRHR